MNREGFLFLGIAMLMLFVMQAEDFFGRAARGSMDLGRLFTTWWTLITAAMLLTWFCFRVTVFR